MLFLMAALATTSPSISDERLSKMVAVYQDVCLKAFPDDKAVEALMNARNARALTQAEVTVTMGKDPARGWSLAEGYATVWLEMPPYHACSVRWNTPQVGDLGPYRAAVDAYKRTMAGFQEMSAQDVDQGIIHIHGSGERRRLPDGSIESLLVVDQQINDPKRRAAGATGVVIRFVHQFVVASQVAN